MKFFRYLLQISLAALPLFAAAPLTAQDAEPPVRAAVNVGGTFTANTGLPLERAEFSVDSLEPAVVTPRLEQGELRFTGLTTGSTLVRLFEGDQVVRRYEITVLTADSLPLLEDIRVVGGGASAAVMQAGASIDDGNSFRYRFDTEQSVQVDARIEPPIGHTGFPAQLFVAARVETAQGTDAWFFKDRAGDFRPWDQQLDSLAAAENLISLNAVQQFNIFEGFLAAGTYEAYVGYSVDDGPLVYSASPLRITVEAGGDPLF